MGKQVSINALLKKILLAISSQLIKPTAYHCFNLSSIFLVLLTVCPEAKVTRPRPGCGGIHPTTIFNPKNLMREPIDNLAPRPNAEH